MSPGIFVRAKKVEGKRKKKSQTFWKVIEVRTLYTTVDREQGRLLLFLFVIDPTGYSASSIPAGWRKRKKEIKIPDCFVHRLDQNSKERRRHSPVDWERELFGVNISILLWFPFPCRYFKQSAATFFGLDESKERELRQRWEDRRRRLAERRCGTLRESCSHDVSAVSLSLSLETIDPSTGISRHDREKRKIKPVDVLIK